MTLFITLLEYKMTHINISSSNDTSITFLISSFFLETYGSIFLVRIYGYSRVHFQFRISDPIFYLGSDTGPDLKQHARIGFGSKISWIRSTLRAIKVHESLSKVQKTDQTFDNCLQQNLRSRYFKYIRL